MNLKQSLSDAVARTRYLLFERPRVRRWVSFGALHMLGGSAGLTGFSPPVPGLGKSRPTALLGLSAAAWKWSPELLWVAAAGGIFSLLMGAGLLWLSSVARVVLIENLIHDRDALLEPMNRLSRLGTAVFGWTVITTLGLLLAVAGLLAALAPPVPALTAPLSYGQALDLASYVMTVLSLLTPLLLAMVTLNIVNNELVVPVMYHENLGALSGWAMTLKLMARQPQAWAAWLVSRAVLGVACGAFELIAILVFAHALALGLALPSLLAVLMLGSHPLAIMGVVLLAVLAFVTIIVPAAVALATPFTVFLRCFSMYCLQQAADMALLPAAGQRVC